MMKIRIEPVFAHAVVVAVIAAFFAVMGTQPQAATLATQEQAAQAVSVSSVNVNLKDGVVSGELINKSPRPIREVQLLIRYTWLWNNEMRPGQDELSDADFYTVEGEIPPGATRPFNYKRTRPLPSRPDGRYEVSVSVAGFTEIIPAR
jgi:hypothetical protein